MLVINSRVSDILIGSSFLNTFLYLSSHLLKITKKPNVVLKTYYILGFLIFLYLSQTIQ